MTRDTGGANSWNRRDFLSVGALGVLGLATRRLHVSRADNEFAYIGTYTSDGRSKGIYRLFLDTTSGVMRVDGLAAESRNPSFLALHPNGRTLYAVNEVQDHGGRATGGVTAFAVARETGALTLLDQLPSHGKDPCYVSVDRTGRTVLVANYTSGSIAAFTLGRDGRLRSTRTIVQHQGHGPDAERQTSPHAHCILTDPSNRYVLAADLGVDGVLIYRFDERTGSIAAVANRVATKPGAGPRHLAFHPNGRFLYVVNELDSSLAVYTYDVDRGSLDQVQVTAASPGGTVAGNHPADVHVATSGRHLYSSNRGDDTIAVFGIDARSGQVTPVEQVSTGGKTPRNFALDPTGRFLLVANQLSDSILSFRIDAETGRLTPTGQTAEIPVPVCIRFR
jgi:6-phosphogluconolactonase